MQSGDGFRLCSVVSREAGDDPAGSATPFSRCLMLEVRPPYTRNALDSRRFPEGLSGFINAAMDSGSIQKFAAFMPDREYSRKGYARAFLFGRPDADSFAAFEKLEAFAPLEDFPSVVEALVAGEPPPDEYRVESSETREVFVCTHNNRDVCCGKFGDPIYKELRSAVADESTRIWRSSHLGGHRFAATMMDFPSGTWWGHLDRDFAPSVIRRDRPFRDFLGNYRGWSGLDRFAQIVEREILAENGWSWLKYGRSGESVYVNEDNTLIEVRIEYEDPKTGANGAYQATVEAYDSVMTLGSSGGDPLEEVVQYRVSHLKHV